MEGRPYRLYTDASGEALGCCLQQVQPISVKYLKGTKTYERPRNAYRKGGEVPKLVNKVSAKGATGASPHFLLYGFEPRNTPDLSDVDMRKVY